MFVADANCFAAASERVLGETVLSADGIPAHVAEQRYPSLDQRIQVAFQRVALVTNRAKRGADGLGSDRSNTLEGAGVALEDVLGALASAREVGESPIRFSREFVAPQVAVSLCERCDVR